MIHHQQKIQHSNDRKMKNFRELLSSKELSFLMEAHNGLSARIVQKTGFSAIWASGLSISSAMGFRDSNEASWTQVLETVEFMADNTDIPILLDGDTGHGNFNNFRMLVKKLCHIGVAGVCIEDKVFPKTNSFIGTKQRLADVDEFCGKIKAGKDTQLHESFSIIARIESLIAGLGMDDALKRAYAYHEAGADGLVIHSKNKDADEVLEFARLWNNRCPLILIPTKYYNTPTEDFRKVKASAVIWANHNLRSSFSIMQKTCKTIYEEESLVNIEKNVATVNEIFSLFDYEELAKAEEYYLSNHAIRGAHNAC